MFVDTNVLVSAFVARGLCADLLRYLLAEHEILTGETNLAELTRTLRDKFGASHEQLREVESQLREHTIVPDHGSASPIQLRDPDDAVVLVAAIAGESDLLVTGDKDLLVVAADSPLPILSPRQAWESLRRYSGLGSRLTT